MQDFSYRTKLKLSVVDPDPETLSQVWGGGGEGGGRRGFFAAYIV